MQTNRVLILLVLVAALSVAACASEARVGPLQTESQAVDLGDDAAVSVEINLGAGDLRLAGGAEKLLEADFTYNVARLKPQVTYTAGRLAVRQPEVPGMPNLVNIGNFRNEWDLRLHDGTPMDLRLEIGGGVSDLRLAGLPLTGLAVNLGAGASTLDLSGDWAHDLNVAIDSGAANISVPRSRYLQAAVPPLAGTTVQPLPVELGQEKAVFRG